MIIKRFAILALTIPTLLVGLTTGDRAVPAGPSLDFDQEESDLQIKRAQLYLERHGDNGRIDPERRLRRVKAEYTARRLRAEADRLSAQSIPGNVWSSLGPRNGAGRATGIAVHPNQPGTIYLGAAGGGLWKTTDSGNSWVPLTESISDLSVGAVALAPTDPNTIYLGTGEGGLAIDFIPGIGFLKSTDGGNNWILPSSVLATQFFRISVNPSDSQELVVGTNRGGYRSTDGGSTWAQVIDSNLYPSVTDIVRHPTNPDILYATTWDAFHWCARSGSCGMPSSKVLRSEDGGVTWKERSDGIPQSTSTLRVNRLSLAISQTNPSVLYAATSILDLNSSSSERSHILKTTDEGRSWTDLPSVFNNSSSNVTGFMAAQAWYNNTIVVSPTNENLVIAGGTLYVRSTDGGSTFAIAPFMFTPTSAHVDAHDLRYQGSTLYIANDGGLWISNDNGETSVERNSGLVTRQYYSLAIDPVNRNRVIAGAQDNGTGRRPDSGGTLWTAIIGGDGFECGVLPTIPEISFGTIQGAVILRSKNSGLDPRPSYTRITPPYSFGEATPFLSQFQVDPNSATTVYTSTHRLWRSTNAGDSWDALPTATTDGSVWLDNSTIGAFALGADGSIMAAKLINDGGTNLRTVFLSTDGGNTWSNKRSGLPGRGINNLEIDRTNPNIAYAALAGTTGPSVYKTTDRGDSWFASASGLPSFSAQAVRVDPTDSTTVYCGTDVGVYRSTDQGATWLPFGVGLPASSIQDLKISDDGTLLRAATHGRGVWELQIPATGNTPPAVTITTPAQEITVAKGSSVDFAGIVGDADPGDSATGAWIFPDTWETVQTGAGATSISHTFDRAGVFPVTLTAKDSHKTLSSSAVFVTVHEPFENCSIPFVIPDNGPFPVVIQTNNEQALLAPTADAPPCVPRGAGVTRSLWFEFRPQRSGTYEFTSCGSSINVVLSLWTGDRCGPHSPVDQGCNNVAPSGSNCFRSRTADLVVRLSAGQTYRLRVNGLTSAEVGPFTLTIDALLPRITGASISGKKLIVTGVNFDSGSVLIVNGAGQKTKHDSQNPTTIVIGKKAGKKIAPGQTVSLQVRTSDGSVSAVFEFTR